MFISSVLDTTAIDEKQVQSFFSKLTLEKLLYAAVLELPTRQRALSQ